MMGLRIFMKNVAAETWRDRFTGITDMKLVAFGRPREFRFVAAP